MLGGKFADELRQRRRISLCLRKECVYAPKEHAGVPEEAFAVDVLLRGRGVRLFDKSLYASKHAALAAAAEFLGHLQVTKTRRGKRRRYSEREQRIGLRRA